MKTHLLKTIQPYFDDISLGKKPFELRKNDRNFKLGDIILLIEYNPVSDQIIPKIIATRVTYFMGDNHAGIEQGYCILGVTVLDHIEIR
jgi:hypothetical protein